MNSTDNPALHAPQDTSAHSMPPHDDGDAGAAPDFGPGAFFAPALRGDSEQFPVLKAFQAYVEEERERARRRVVVVSAFSIAAITVLVSLFLVALWFMMRRNDQLNDRLLDIVASRPAATVAPAVVAPASPVEPAPAPMPDERASELQAKLAALEEANAAMVRRMEELQTLPDALAASVGGMISNAMEHALPATATSAPLPPVAGDTQPATAATVSPLPADPAAPADPDAAAQAAPQPAPAELNTIRVTPISQAQPAISGYRTEHILLKTDAGVTIPWRIAVPE